jgi:hypothetical protein
VLAVFCWLDFKEGPAMRERLFEDPDTDLGRLGQEGISDEDVILTERPIANEHDREIETETSKCFVNFFLY